VTTPALDTADTMVAPVAAPPARTGSASAGNRRRLSALLLGAAAIIVAIALVAYFALQPAIEGPSGEPFTLAGTVWLSKDIIKTVDLPTGYKCAGARDYGDISPNSPITVEDESGKLLAKGSIEKSSSNDDGCVMQFEVGDVPAGARFYRVQVGHGHEMSYTEDEAKAGVEFLMRGTDDPTCTTRPRTTTPTRIPQISAKRVGIKAKGIIWDNQAILEEHLRLRNTYPDVRLLRSGDWSTYDGRDFWVTVVGLHSSDPYDVLMWCTEAGFDRDNCIAKIVSTTHPIEGSTKLNP
jgi:hypothetical protein